MRRCTVSGWLFICQILAVPEFVRPVLIERGHRVDTTKGPITYPIMLHIDHATGVIHAAGDPQAERPAAALQ